MSNLPVINVNVARVGGLIERDIRRRGLSTGQQYLTAGEAGKVFGVSTPLASRAMAHLAERDVLIRKRGVGTFVGPEAAQGPTLNLRLVHVLTTPERLRTGLLVGELIEGVLEAVDGYDVQINVLRRENRVAYVRSLLEKASGEGWLSGMVLVGCSREIQELALETCKPTAVFGGVFGTTRLLPSADVDQHGTGRLMARYAADRGHRRMCLVMRDTWLPGDHRTLDGINEVLAEAGLPPGTLTVRNFPVDAEVAEAEIRHLLTSSRRPTALLCRSRFFAQVASDVAASIGLTVPDDLLLISDVDSLKSADEIRWPKVCPELSFKDQAAVVGRLLHTTIERPDERARHETIPVQLVEPNGKA